MYQQDVSATYIFHDYQSILSINFSVNISAEHVLKVKGSKGDVDVKFKLAGYNEEVLAKAGITNPVSSYIRQFVRKLSKYGLSIP